MAFTNVWDTTFPPDSQLANLLGSDIRNGVKVDVQQRMAAISGLDANKPTFNLDAQPANWNGILFFATDTGNIYQFNNPSWTNITSSFILKSTALKNVTQVTHTGTTSLDTIYTLTIPGNVMGSTGRIRITVLWFINAATAATGRFTISFGGTAIGLAGNITYATYGSGNELKSVLEGGNVNSVSSQGWPSSYTFGPANGVTQFSGNVTSAVNTASPVTVLVQFASGNNADSQTFSSITLEFI